jgi:UDP-N-acetyl-D-galactosamine dehydrogenase
MENDPNLKKNLAIIGLGYVGLPLAVSFAKKHNVVGFDISQSRIDELKAGIDITHEFSHSELNNLQNLKFTTDSSDIKGSDFFIITVPTPVDNHNSPDLSHLISASEIVGAQMNKGAYIVYESTVFPGCTEDICIPVLEKISGLTFNEDFFVGYSPERVNPGDELHRIEEIIKVTSGSTPVAAKFIDSLYREIIKVGTHIAPSIKIAEAAKVIENTQRDLNIALMNELSIIFNLLDLNTEDVLKAASTKWNFLPFKPGLVGGHCIGIDPYYLTYKAESLGYHPEIILAGRRLNDSMPKYIAGNLIKCMCKNNISISQAKILMLGCTFKENCPDLRNSKTLALVDELIEYGLDVDIFDPLASGQNQKSNINFVDEPKCNYYDGVILAVKHQIFIDFGVYKIKDYCKKEHVFFDLKGAFSREHSNFSL